MSDSFQKKTDSSGSFQKKPDSMAKKAFLFGSGTLVSRILGFLRDALIFSFMPLDVRDAWLAAFRIPNFFRRLLGEGGLSASFIPIYVKLSNQGGKLQRQQLVDGVFGLLIGTALLICGLCFIFMEPIINTWLSGSGFREVPGKLAMTVQMARVMVFFLFFIVLFAFFMALLNGLKKFTLTGFAPLFLNLAIIAGLVFFRDRLPMAAAWAVLIGGAIQALVLLPSVIRSGVLPRLSFRVNHPLVKKVVLKFIPTLFGVGVLQILALINLYFASQLSPGTVSYIYLGDRLLELPLSLIAVSLGTTLLPSLSVYWNGNEKALFLKSLGRHLQLFYFLALPASVGLWFMGFDIIDVLFSRGEFTNQEVPLVASILKIHCLTLLCAGSLKILNQAFYAAGDTLTPALVSMFGLLVHLFLAPWLMAKLAIQGLVLSTSLISLLNFLLCLTFLQKKIGVLNWKPLGKQFLYCSLAALPMGVCLWFIGFSQWRQGLFVPDFVFLLALIALSAVIYFVSASFFKVKEMESFKKKFLHRFGNTV